MFIVLMRRKIKPMAKFGKGAEAARIEAARRLFPQIWFDAATTEAGQDALGWYNEKRDAARGIGLGLEHDWSSHACDAFGLMCVDERSLTAPFRMRPSEEAQRMYHALPGATHDHRR